MTSKGIADPYGAPVAARCRHGMVVTWCAWCTGMPEWAPLDNGDDGERAAEAAERTNACAGCGGPITPRGSTDRDNGGDPVCWRCSE